MDSVTYKAPPQTDPLVLHDWSREVHVSSKSGKTERYVQLVDHLSVSSQLGFIRFHLKIH